MKKLIRPALAASALAACLTSTGCIGPNNTYNSVLSWNSRLSEQKWLNELVYLGGHIIPAYPLALFADMIVFNSVEFWTGNNWIKTPEAYKPQETASK